MAIALCPSALAASTISSTRAAPSSIEYSVWLWRWTKPSAISGRSLSRRDEDGARSRAKLARTCDGPRLEVRARAGIADAGRQRSVTHLLELGRGGGLLGEQRRLDAVEESLEPPDQLRLGDAELGLGRHVGAEGQRHLAQF